LQLVRIIKGFGAKKIKSFSIPLIIAGMSLFHHGIVAFCLIKTSTVIFPEFFSFFDFEYHPLVLIAGVYLKN